MNFNNIMEPEIPTPSDTDLNHIRFLKALWTNMWSKTRLESGNIIEILIYCLITSLSQFLTSIPRGGGGSRTRGYGSIFVYDSWDLFTQLKFGEKSYSLGARWGFAKVGRSGFFSAVFSEKLQVRTVHGW